MKESKPYQSELAVRASDYLPFVDSKDVKVVCSALRENRKGIIHSATLSEQEMEIIRKRLGFLGQRLVFEPVRLQESMGTKITVASKKGTRYG